MWIPPYYSRHKTLPSSFIGKENVSYKLMKRVTWLVHHEFHLSSTAYPFFCSAFQISIVRKNFCIFLMFIFGHRNCVSFTFVNCRNSRIVCVCSRSFMFRTTCCDNGVNQVIDESFRITCGLLNRVINNGSRITKLFTI